MGSERLGKIKSIVISRSDLPKAVPLGIQQGGGAGRLESIA